MENEVLNVKDLEVEFSIARKNIKAIEEVSFTVNAGETLGIVGESGCGKSVTANSIMGLLPRHTGKISGGSISVMGERIEQYSDKQMRNIRGSKISMIFQEPMTSLNPVQKIGTQIVEMIQAHEKISKKDAQERAIDILKQVGIPMPELRIKEYPFEMSGGMRQRVMIAMALVCNPKILIADEPTTALDVTIQAQILELIKDLKTKNDAAILLITHDMGVVAEVTDNVMVMYGGQIVEYGATYDVFTAPRHPYTKGLLKSLPRLDEEVDRLNTISGQVPGLRDMPSYCRFANRCPYCEDRCKEENPPLKQEGKRKIRCFLEGEG